jgi:hypothetical protein
LSRFLASSSFLRELKGFGIERKEGREGNPFEADSSEESSGLEAAAATTTTTEERQRRRLRIGDAAVADSLAARAADRGAAALPLLLLAEARIRGRCWSRIVGVKSMVVLEKRCRER